MLGKYWQCHIDTQLMNYLEENHTRHGFSKFFLENTYIVYESPNDCLHLFLSLSYFRRYVVNTSTENNPDGGLDVVHYEFKTFEGISVTVTWAGVTGVNFTYFAVPQIESLEKEKSGNWLTGFKK